MKQTQLLRCFICLVFISLFVAPGQAQTWKRRQAGLQGDDYHFGYVSGTLGYSMLQQNNAGVISQGQLGGAIGLGYEFRNSGFWTSVGAQLGFHRSKLVVDEYTCDFQGADTQGKDATLHYRVNQTDQLKWNFIEIPILFGYYVHGFHIGAGPKLSYALQPKTTTTGNYNLSATNKEYNVTFENMPEHGYTDYSFNTEANNRLNIEVSLVGEIGYDLLSSVGSRSMLCNVLKLSFYVEYGLNSIAGKWDDPQAHVVPQQSDATKATINPYLNTFSENHYVVPFYAGAKLTYMIGGSRTARGGFHHGCMCYQ